MFFPSNNHNTFCTYHNFKNALRNLSTNKRIRSWNATNKIKISDPTEVNRGITGDTEKIEPILW